MVKNDIELVFFTRWFPYNNSKEYSFIMPELEILSKKFKSITIVPQEIKDDQFKINLNIKIDCSLSHDLKKVLSQYFLTFLIQNLPKRYLKLEQILGKTQLAF